MSHDCVNRINGLLKSRNTELSGSIDFSVENRELIQLATSKADDKVRGRAVAMFASHCPFCGVKLNDRPSAKVD